MLSDDLADGGSNSPSSKEQVLRRIADTLGTTVDALHASGGNRAEMRRQTAAEEGAALLQAFSCITDPRVRRRVLTYVQEAAAPGGTQTHP